MHSPIQAVRFWRVQSTIYVQRRWDGGKGVAEPLIVLRGIIRAVGIKCWCPASAALCAKAPKMEWKQTGFNKRACTKTCTCTTNCHQQQPQSAGWSGSTIVTPAHTLLALAM